MLPECSRVGRGDQGRILQGEPVPSPAALVCTSPACRLSHDCGTQNIGLRSLRKEPRLLARRAACRMRHFVKC